MDDDAAVAPSVPSIDPPPMTLPAVLDTARAVLPDSRAKAGRGAVPGPGGVWIPIFCASCGVEGGMVPAESMTFAFWLCVACFATHGALTNVMMLPDEVFWERVKHAQLETYGRVLTTEELQAVVEADASPLARLIRQGR